MCFCQVAVNRKSIMDWYNFCRDLCSDDLLHNPVVLGGSGHIVAVDETLVARRKPGNAQGHPVPERWCFGGVDLATGDFVLTLVSDCSEAMLLQVIQAKVVPGTRVLSDCRTQKSIRWCSVLLQILESKIVKHARVTNVTSMHLEREQDV